jgi:hypothetical protein
MEPLADSHPGPDESWQELADHAAEHDDLSTLVHAQPGPFAWPHLPLDHDGIAAYLAQESLRTAVHGGRG